MTLYAALHVLGGGAIGYAYHRLVGCRSGACPITANPWVATAYGALLALAPLIASCSPAQGAPTQARSSGAAMTEGSLQSQLQYLREEEKLARDVYLTLYQRWELRIFDNISGAEQRHMDRIGAVLAARQIPDPVTDDSVGVFQDASLGALYQELVQRGSNSLLDALRVGAMIEDLDLRDLDLLRSQVQDQDRDEDVLAAVDTLACGSRNHLRAFTRQLSNRGATYAPQHLDAERYASILATEHERCGGGHGGGGGGHGRGRGGGGHGRGGGGHGRGECM